MNEYLLIRNEYISHKPILHIDMDGPTVDYDTAVAHCSTESERDCVAALPGFFQGLKPTKGAIEAFNWLIQHFECFFLTTTPWDIPQAGAEKRIWIDSLPEHLAKYFHKRLITTHFKNLVMGDYLIDDRAKNGASHFSGEWIQFGSTEFPDWQTIINYLARRINVSTIFLSLQ
jgi:5'-nucleotidase